MLQKCLKLYLSIFISLLISSTAFSQNDASYISNIKHFTTLEGLSHREVLFIFEDNDGINWISTPNGLNRFDGYYFKHFLGKNQGVDLRNIGRITQDDEGWLWLIKAQETVFFNPKTEVFQTVKERFGANCVLETTKRPTSNLNDFPRDKEGRIYFISDDTNIVYSYLSTEGFKKITVPFNLKFIYFTNVLDNKSFVFFQSFKWLTYDASVGALILAPISEGIYAIKDSLIYHIQFDITENQKPERWRIYNNRYYFFDEEGNFLTSIESQMTYTRAQNIYVDSGNKYWISSNSGFDIVDIKKNNFEFLKKPDFLLLFDAQGIIADTTKMTIALARGGMADYDFATKQWQYLPESHWNRAMSISKEGFWITGPGEMVFRQANRVEKFTAPKFTYKRDVINFWAIAPSQLSKERLWLGAENGLFAFNTTTKAYKHIENKFTKQDNSLIQNMIPDKKNKHWLWLCTSQGLILFDEQKEISVHTYNIEQTGKYYLPTSNVQHLYQDKTGVYWLATTDGVIRWDKAKNEYRQITVADGLPVNVIHAIYPDDYGNLWMSSNHGIIRMNQKTFDIKNYLLQDGIGQREFSPISSFSFRDKNGKQRLFFGGLEGVTTFYPEDFQTVDKAIKTRLNILKYEQFDGEKKTIVDYTLTTITNNKIIIQPNDYIHSLEVGLVNYENIDNNQYRYQLKIKGVASGWITQKSRFIKVGQLPYGKHQLIITAKTLNNLAAKNDLTIDIIVRRPFYLTWWFVLITISTIVGAIIY